MLTPETGKQRSFVILTALHAFFACLVLANEILAINNRVPGGNFPIEHKSSWARVLLFCGVAVMCVAAVWILRVRKDLAILLPSLKFVVPVAVLATLASILSNYPSVTGWCCEVSPTRYFGFPFSYLSGDRLLAGALIPTRGTLTRFHFHIPYEFFLDLLFWSSAAFLVFGLVSFLIQKGKAAREANKEVQREKLLLPDRMIRLFLAILFGAIAGLVAFFSPARPPAAPVPLATPTSTPTQVPASNDRVSILVFQNTPLPKLLAISTSTPTPVSAAEAACPGAQPVGATTGQIAMLRVDPSILGRVHELPDPQSKVLGQLRSDELFITIAGPQCADGLIWWKVQSARGLLGWIAEGYVSSYWLVTPTPSGANPGETLTPVTETAPTPAAVSGAELVRVLTEPTGKTNSVDWSPDGTRLASLGGNSLRIWDWARGQQFLILTLPNHHGVRSIAWSPDGTRVSLGGALFSLDGRASPVAEVRSSSTGELLAKMDMGGVWEFGQLKWSPNGLLLAGGSKSGSVMVWDAATGEKLQTLQAHTKVVMGIAWSPDGRFIASSSMDGTLRVFNVISGKQTSLLINDAPDCNSWSSDQTACIIRASAWSPDGGQIAFGSGSSAITAWNPISGQVRTIGRQREVDIISAVAWSPDGKRLASTAVIGGTIRIWDLTDAEHPSMLALPDIYQATSAAWSPDGKYLAVTGQAQKDDTEGLIWIWSIQ